MAEEKGGGSSMMKRPALYVVAMPIGNPQDITLRALEVLRDIDLLICEERKIGSRYQAAYQLKVEMELLNEHDSIEQSHHLYRRIVEEKRAAALVSDAGTPLFADPGSELVRLCHSGNIPVIPVPGASSLMSALMASGLELKQFMYYGFLPANKEERLLAIQKVKSWKELDIVLLEAPYRLKPLLRDLITGLGSARKAILAYRLTFPEEQFFEGTLKQLAEIAEKLPKGEYVLIIRKATS